MAPYAQMCDASLYHYPEESATKELRPDLANHFQNQTFLFTMKTHREDHCRTPFITFCIYSLFSIHPCGAYFAPPLLGGYKLNLRKTGNRSDLMVAMKTILFCGFVLYFATESRVEKKINKDAPSKAESAPSAGRASESGPRVRPVLDFGFWGEYTDEDWTVLCEGGCPRRSCLQPPC